MKFLSRTGLCTALTCLCTLALAHDNHDEVEVDVAIVGGGASGAYAAVRLRDDYKKSIVVIEKANRLGGHVHAYYPANGRPINYGVQAYLNRDTTAAFFKRFNVKLINPDLENYLDLLLKTKNTDFNTGRNVDVRYGPVDVAGVPAALVKYIEFAEKYQPWFENGYWKRGDIPEDLLLPFGQFLKKHDLEGSLGVLRNLLWLSDAINTPTWTVMAVAGHPQMAAFGLGLTGPSFKWPETHSSETLYNNVLDHLRHDVLLESTVVSSKRTDKGVTLTVQTPSGKKIIKAKKLLISATPSPGNICSWDLDSNEKNIFSKFTWETLYVGIVNNTGLPKEVTGIRNAPNNSARLFLPQGNFCDAYARGGYDGDSADLWNTRVLGRSDLSDEAARSLMITPLKKMAEAGTYKIADPKVVAFASHSPTAPRVSADELKAGFYDKLYKLQGQRRTYWTGLAWAPDYTPILWDFNEKLFPQILEGL